MLLVDYVHYYIWLGFMLWNQAMPSTETLVSDCDTQDGKTEGNARLNHFRKTFTSKVEMTSEEFQQQWKSVTAGASKPLNDEEIDKIFNICDSNQDGKLVNKELEDAYNWFRPIVDPKRALVNVDVQNDFISGSLALKDCPAKQDGAEVVPVINKLMEEMQFDMIAYSMDYHPKDHISFIENVYNWTLDENSKIKDPAEIKVGDIVIYDTEYGPVEQKIWPMHCVQNTKGCEFHKDLKVVEDGILVKKGEKRDVESYTAFGAPQYGSPTILKSELEKHNITELYLTGLAQDVCVANTGLDALNFGYSVCMVEDAQRGVAEDTIEKMKEDVIAAGGRYVSSDKVIKGDVITLDDRLDAIRRKMSLETVAKQEN